jgi:hypothetical protein
MLGSLVLAVQKEKTRCWEAWYRQFRRKNFDTGRLGTGQFTAILDKKGGQNWTDF